MFKTRIVILGANGQLGRSFTKNIVDRCDCYSLPREIAPIDDLTKTKKILLKIRPDVVINTAAYTKVDEAETEPDAAYKINSWAVKSLAQFCKNQSMTLVHFSTDYVFDGNSTDRYKETDNAKPLSVYGLSKLKADEAIVAEQMDALIFRVSWVYSPHGSNFPRTILKAAEKNDSLKIINDQIGAPTSTDLISKTVIRCLRQYLSCSKRKKAELSGIYNLTASGDATWYDFAKYLIDGWGALTSKSLCDPNQILPITSDEYPTLAVRPKNSLLSSNKITEYFDVDLPNWKVDANKFLSALEELTNERT